MNRILELKAWKTLLRKFLGKNVFFVPKCNTNIVFYSQHTKEKAAQLAIVHKRLTEHNATNNNVFPKMRYSIVVADVDYGLDKKESRGDVEWTSADFIGFFKNARDANLSPVTTFIVFLHDRQIEVRFFVLQVLNIFIFCFEDMS